VKYPTLDDLVVAYSHDLSVGGMFLRARRFLPVNAVIRVHIELPEDGGEVPIIARVAFVRDDKDAAQTGKPPGMGIQFLDIGGEAQRRIEAFISERLARSTPDDTTPARRILQVVVIDDDAQYRDLAAQAFRARGDRVRTAGDGLEGLGVCLKDPPDLVVSDVQMPRMDGWQLLRMLRTRPTLAGTPVLFLTTLSGDADRLRGYQLGVDDYIEKPYRPQELLARADRAIARSGGGRGGPARKTLRGDLEHVPITSVLQLLEVERKTGMLLVVSSRTFRLWLRNGRPITMEIEGETQVGTPPGALFRRLVEVRDGLFELAVQDVAGDDRFGGASITELLLEHARLSDEASR
jgi:DNA-binding response OmpR family regulator/Tfp pilus assembly protein PilZ